MLPRERMAADQLCLSKNADDFVDVLGPGSHCSNEHSSHLALPKSSASRATPSLWALEGQCVVKVLLFTY